MVLKAASVKRLRSAGIVENMHLLTVSRGKQSRSE